MKKRKYFEGQESTILNILLAVSISLTQDLVLPVGSDEFVEKCGDSCKKEPEREEFLENILLVLN